MGSTRKPCGKLRVLRRRASLLEIAQHGSSGIARLLGQPGTLAANSSSACPRSRCNCPAARALELALSFPESLDFLADRNRRRLHSRADDFRRVAPEAQTADAARHFAQEQGAYGSGKRRIRKRLAPEQSALLHRQFGLQEPPGGNHQRSYED